MGIVGVGGLGTMGIKIANALGHQVVAISTSANKEEIAKLTMNKEGEVWD